MDSSKLNFQHLYLEETTSTNDVILELYKQNKIENFFVCCAEKQTKGRGRFNRQWRTFPQHSLAFSFLLTDFIEQIPLVLCVSLHKVLMRLYNKDVKIKWPNDIYFNNKKIAGILIESYVVNSQRIYIAGIGLNITKPDEDDEDVEDFIGFLFEESVEANREDILNSLIQQIKSDIEKLQKDGFKSFKKYFIENCMYLNELIEIIVGNNVQKGTFCGINSEGHLILEQECTILNVHTGQIVQQK